ncbi:hypothetical protein FQA39_LY04077 [Lamprigera yunnana]|nr:hypothetical protein FQA39_LY04077 [Lamprigera yunnana]
MTDAEYILLELKSCVSEYDNIILGDNPLEGSEWEDNVEVDSEYANRADNTDQDADYYSLSIEHDSVLVQEQRPWNSDEKNIGNCIDNPQADLYSSNNANHLITLVLMMTASGESSIDECSNMHVDTEEVTSVIREQCTNNTNNIIYLCTFEKHKNIFWPRTRNLREKMDMCGLSTANFPPIASTSSRKIDPKRPLSKAELEKVLMSADSEERKTTEKSINVTSKGKKTKYSEYERRRPLTNAEIESMLYTDDSEDGIISDSDSKEKSIDVKSEKIKTTEKSIYVKSKEINTTEKSINVTSKGKKRKYSEYEMRCPLTDAEIESMLYTNDSEESHQISILNTESMFENNDDQEEIVKEEHDIEEADMEKTQPEKNLNPEKGKKIYRETGLLA